MGLYPKNINEFLVLQGIPRGPNSQVFFVDPANGSDSNHGRSFLQPLASIEAAYALCVTNQHDVILYVAGSSGNNLAAALTWSKNYTHLVGWCAPVLVGQRARIFQTSTLTGASPLITVSGQGCIFKDIYVFQGVNDATSLINISVTGERNYFENVHIAGGGHAAQAINGGASLSLAGSENTFKNCTIGVDTVSAATGMMGLIFPAGAQASRNIFIDCRVTMYAGHTGAGFVEVMDGTAIDRYTLFKDCVFINSNSDNFLMASGFVIPAYAANNSSRILLQNCMIHGVSKLDASDRGVLYGNMSAVVGADESGVAVELKT